MIRKKLKLIFLLLFLFSFTCCNASKIYSSIPAISWYIVNAKVPKVSSDQVLRQCDRVVLVWTVAEWAALMHVFCDSVNSLKHNFEDSELWKNKDSYWTEYTGKTKPPAGIYGGYWFEYCYVDVNFEITACLIKCNVHLDEDGSGITQPDTFNEMLEQIITKIKPKLIISTGTAGGASNTQKLGTCVMTNSAAYQYPENNSVQSSWSVYSSDWYTNTDLDEVKKLAIKIPVTDSQVTRIVEEVNNKYECEHTVEEYDPDKLLELDSVPEMSNYAHKTNRIPLLTCTAFLVGGTNNGYKNYACLEMDDAEIYKYVKENHPEIIVGSIKNISDPVQNSKLPENIQSAFAAKIYKAYGLYTSVNSALLVWACLNSGKIDFDEGSL